MADFVCGTGLWGNPKLPGDPDNNSILTATPGFGGIQVEWTYPELNPQGLAHVILYRSTASNFETALKHKIVTGSFFFDPIQGQTSTVYYYWIKFVSVNGTVGDLIGPAWSTVRPMIGDLIEALTGEIDSGVLAQALKEKINRINPLADALDTEIGARVAAIGSLSDTFTALERDTLGTLDDFNGRLLALLDADSLFVDELNDTKQALEDADKLIKDTQQDLSDEADRLDGRVDVIQDTLAGVRDDLGVEADRLDQKADSISEALAGARQALELRDEQITDRLAENENQFVEHQAVFVEEGKVTAERLDGIYATLDENAVALGNYDRLRVEQDLIEALQFEYIKAESANGLAAFRTQEYVRITNEEALAQLITQQTSRIDDNEATIGGVSTTVADNYSALASRIGEISAKLDASPVFASGFEPGADFDQWIAPDGNTLTAVSNGEFAGNQSALATSQEGSPTADNITGATRVEIPLSISQSFESYEITVTLYAKLPDTNPASGFAVAYSTNGKGSSGWQYMTATNEWKVYSFSYVVSADSSGKSHYLGLWADTGSAGNGILIDSVSIQRSDANVTDISAAIEAEQQARVTLEEAIANDFQSITAELGEVKSDIQAETLARATKDEALTQQSSDMASRIGSAESNLTSLAQTQASQNTAMSSRASALEAKTSANSTSITNLEKVVSDETEATAQSLSGLESRMGDAETAITNEQQTRASETEALSKSLTGLESAFNTNKSAVTGELQTLADADEAQAQRSSNIESSVSQSNSRITELDSSTTNRFEAISYRADTLESTLGTNSASITSLSKALTNKDEATNVRITQLTSSVNNATSSITNQLNTLANKQGTETERLDALRSEYDGTKALVSQHQTLLQDQNGTIANRFDAIELQAGNNSSLIAAETEARLSDTESLSTRADQLASRLGDAETAITKNESALSTNEQAIATQQELLVSEIDRVSGIIATETISQADLDQALTTTTEGYTAQLEDIQAGLLSERTARVTEDEALSTYSTNLAVRLDEAEGAIASEQRLTAEQDQLEAIQFKAIELSHAGNTAGIQVESDVRVTDREALASQITTIGSEVERNQAVIARDYSTKADTNEAIATLGTALNSRVDAATAALTQETQTRAQKDQALLTQFNQLAATVGDGTAVLQTKIEAKVYGESIISDGSFSAGDGSLWGSTGDIDILAVADAPDNLYVAQGSPAGHFAMFKTSTNGKTRYAISDYEYAIAGDQYSISMWAARMYGANGAISLAVQFFDLDNNRVGWETPIRMEMTGEGGGQNNEWRYSGAETVVAPKGTYRARIVVTIYSSNTTGRIAFTAINASRTDKAVAERIENVQTSVNDNIAAYKETVNTQVEYLNGELQTIGALYTAQVQTNGLIGGFGVYNDGTTVEAGFDVDRFWIGRTNKDKRKPFIIDDDIVYMNNAMIREGSIQEGQLGAITIGKLKKADGTPITTVGGLIRAEAIDAANLSVSDAATFSGDVFSRNYQSGKKGWAILQSGYVEFNEAMIRGNLEVQSITVNGSSPFGAIRLGDSNKSGSVSENNSRYNVGFSDKYDRDDDITKKSSQVDTQYLSKMPKGSRISIIAYPRVYGSASGRVGSYSPGDPGDNVRPTYRQGGMIWDMKVRTRLWVDGKTVLDKTHNQSKRSEKRGPLSFSHDYEHPNAKGGYNIEYTYPGYKSSSSIKAQIDVTMRVRLYGGNVGASYQSTGANMATGDVFRLG